MTSITQNSTASRQQRLLPWIWPCLVLATVYLASSRGQVAAPDVVGIDKVAHFLVFGLLANLIQRAIPKSAHRMAVTIAIVSLIGLADEWHQSFTPGRAVEVADWLSDTAGAALAASLYDGVFWYRRLLEAPLASLFGRRQAPSEERPSGQPAAPGPEKTSGD